MAIGALVCGIISVVLAFTFFTGLGPGIGVILGIIAIILGVLARKSGGGTAATAGLILGIIGTVLDGILYLACAVCAAGAAASLGGLF
jgi:hypothetical protein